MLAAVATRSARPAACFREMGTRPNSGLGIGRRILDSLRQAKDSLVSPSSKGAKQRSLPDALSDLEGVVTNPQLPPSILDGNREMLRRLQGFCLRLSMPSSFPPKETLRVQFAVKKPKGIDYARGLLRTTGADCEESVRADLAALFQRAGVDPSFSFQDREFFGGRAAFLRAMMRKTAGARDACDALLKPEESAAAKKESAALRWKLRMQQMDPLFGALAALPWVVEVDPEKARHVQTTVLDSLEGDGWDVRGAVHKIWAGARDYKALRVGVDPGSCDAIKAVLEHTRRYDEQYGHKVYLPQ
ncbi:hypothetical protein F751_6245 [Auxenochlorella protothecoides]|uniref:Uncharacterized protein n=1 Tax=Auxenochlorella protothecoides TaxID=3075 RepID=A0A087SK40_AUXPR|nr:hypothetical protein F751_6245 [Auxenochlorella protothecoides]KFM26094.1 hypothetical protein F751_6245 [Auxenochlorella protothecoides]